MAFDGAPTLFGIYPRPSGVARMFTCAPGVVRVLCGVVRAMWTMPMSARSSIRPIGSP